MREILQYPDIRLLQKSRELNTTLDRQIIETLMTEMKFTLSGAQGISAPQLGDNVRMIGVCYGNESIFIINPVIVKKSDKMINSEEGCLSIKNGKMIYLVKRHKTVKVKGLDENGKEVTYKGRDMFGRSLQHEIDHLDGILINVKD